MNPIALANTPADARSISEIVVKRFISVYGTPDTPDPKGLIAEYNRALSGTDVALLQRAIDKAIDKHAYRNWPTIGECKGMIAVVAAELDADRRRGLQHPDYAPDPLLIGYSGETQAQEAAERAKRIDAMMQETVAKLKAADKATWEAPMGKNPEPPKLAESGAKLPPGWRDTSRNVFESRPGKLYPEKPAQKLSEVGRFDDLPDVPIRERNE